MRDETVDEDFLKESLEAEQKWLGRFRQSQPPAFQRRETNASSRYSFSTEYNSGKSEYILCKILNFDTSDILMKHFLFSFY